MAAPDTIRKSFYDLHECPGARLAFRIGVALAIDGVKKEPNELRL
jgi:hypothetical protein